MAKRRLDPKKFNRDLSARGEVTGKPGNFLLTSALVAGIGKLAGAGIGAAVGSKQKKEWEQEKQEKLQEQGERYLDQQEMMQTQHSRNVLSTYNPQGDAQMYVKNGGKIYIKPSKRGTFTAAAKKRGKGVQEFASQVMANKENYSPAMVKKANFAKNAAKWNQMGGEAYYQAGGKAKTKPLNEMTDKERSEFLSGMAERIGKKSLTPYGSTLGSMGIYVNPDPNYNYSEKDYPGPFDKKKGKKQDKGQPQLPPDVYIHSQPGKIKYEDGGYMPYPYQDQPRTMINPTLMYKNGGRTLLQRVQGGNTDAYWPKTTEADWNANNPGNVSKHRGNRDMNYYGSSQDQYPHFASGGKTLLQRVQSGDTSQYWMSRSPNNLNNPGNVSRHRDNLRAGDYPGSSEDQYPYFQAGGSMYDQLQQVGMDEYLAYQQGGAAPSTRVPGGEIKQVTAKGQVVEGDNPELIDDVELGTNPGEPDAVVDHGEVMVDAVDENGQPYKQIFSDTVMVPGENVSMAKKAKKYLKQIPKDESSEQAQLVYGKLDELFNVQQMLNGDSHGETAQEAAAGGMDPMAAAAMQAEGDAAFRAGGVGRTPDPMVGGLTDWRKDMMQMGGYVGVASPGTMPEGMSGEEAQRWGNLARQRYQNGGAGYPSAAYDAALREQQMQVPYPSANKKKKMQQGGSLWWGGQNQDAGGVGILDGLLTGIGGAAQGFMPGYQMGYSFTDDMEGDKDIAMGLGSTAALAGSLVPNVATHASQTRKYNYEQEAEALKNKPAGSNQMTAAQAQGMQMGQVGQYQGPDVEQQMAYLEGQINPSYQDGGVLIIADPIPSIEQEYADAKALVAMVESNRMPNTLADMQSLVNPTWGTLNEVDTLRRTSVNMGREHRGPKHDSSSPVSMSERKGPKPKKKSFRNGGRMYYGLSLTRRSLTLAIR